MTKNSKILYAFVAIVMLLCTLSACSAQEDTTVSFAMPYTTDGISLERTALYATGFSGITVNEYLYRDINEAIAKLTKDKLNRSCHMAYVTAEQYKTYFENDDRFRIVLIDSLKADEERDTIYGLWVARQDWIEQCPNTFSKTIKSLLTAMNYRAENNNTSLAQAMTDVKDDSMPVGVASDNRSPESSSQYEHEYTQVMHYIAIYEKVMKKDLEALNVAFGEKEAVYISGLQMQDRYKEFAADLMEMSDFSAVDKAELTPKAENEDDGNEAGIVVLLLSLAGILALAVIVITLRDFIKETKSTD